MGGQGNQWGRTSARRIAFSSLAKTLAEVDHLDV